jgi:hypothetical protein
MLRVRLNIRACLYCLINYTLTTLTVLLGDLGLEVRESAYVTERQISGF